MWQYVVKVAITAALTVAVAEIAKRSVIWAAFAASLPLTSLFAFAWLYVDSGKTEQVAALSVRIFWLVIPSLTLFLVLPLLLRAGWSFWAGLGTACLATACIYLAMIWGLGRLGIRY